MASTPSKVVLVVDDNVDIAEAVAALARLTGCATLVAHSGEDAIACVDAADVSLILLDVHMPGMDGFDVMDALAARDVPRPPIAMFSADRAARGQAMRQGAVAFVGKTSIGEILDLVARYC